MLRELGGQITPLIKEALMATANKQEIKIFGVTVPCCICFDRPSLSQVHRNAVHLSETGLSWKLV